MVAFDQLATKTRHVQVVLRARELGEHRIAARNTRAIIHAHSCAMLDRNGGFRIGDRVV